MNKINKKDLIDLVSENAFLTAKESKKAIDVVFDTLIEAFMNNEEVNISGFGTFKPKVSASRIGSNPSTHQKMKIKSKNVVTFKMSKKLVSKLNEQRN